MHCCVVTTGYIGSRKRFVVEVPCELCRQDLLSLLGSADWLPGINPACKVVHRRCLEKPTNRLVKNAKTGRSLTIDKTFPNRMNPGCPVAVR